MRLPLALLLVLILESHARAAAPPPVEQWIVVVAPDYEKAIVPLIEHRRAQGLRVVVPVLLNARGGADGHTPRHNEVRLVVFFRIGDWIVRIEDGKPKLLV